MRAHRAWLLLPVVSLALVAADAPPRREADQQALAPLAALVGQWRGVGQVQRGSNVGAWLETSDWAWKFTGDRAALTFTTPEGKHLRSGTFQPGPQDGQLELSLDAGPGQDPVHYTGKLAEDGSLQLVAVEDPGQAPHRISIRLVAGGDRLLMLYERRFSTADRYGRMAEVGYTRQGSQFGQGISYVECVVTGGKAAIPVMHEGQTYYVCCTGCRDYFNEDPSTVLAEYKAKKEAERKKKSVTTP